MNKDRLLKLANLLEADAVNPVGIKFDLGTWGTIIDPKTPVSCGTSACAMGLAAISGAFRSDGLGYTMNKDGFVNITFPEAEGGFEAGERLFDISDQESSWLFDPEYYDEEKEIVGAEGERIVARRIRDFVAGTAKPDPDDIR